MWLVALLARLVFLAECNGAPSSIDRPSPPGAKPELVCSNTNACLTALPVPTGTTRRGP
jgi:hypothetical protein